MAGRGGEGRRRISSVPHRSVPTQQLLIRRGGDGVVAVDTADSDVRDVRRARFLSFALGLRRASRSLDCECMQGRALRTYMVAVLDAAASGFCTLMPLFLQVGLGLGRRALAEISTFARTVPIVPTVPTVPTAETRDAEQSRVGVEASLSPVHSIH